MKILSKRRKIPKKIETAVLTRSRRRCCICFCIKNDDRVKRGQIAHLDHDRNNIREENLVYLCVKHHDIYDSKTSQSKGFTLDEVRNYQEQMFNHFVSSSGQHLADTNLSMRSQWSALELMGGRTTVCKSIVSAIKVAKEQTGISSTELAHLAGLPDNAVETLEKNPILLDSNAALSLMAVLSVQIDKVLPLPQLSAKQLQQWRLYMRNMKLTACVSAGDPVELLGDIALVLFIRMKAISELDDAHQTKRPSFTHNKKSRRKTSG